MRERERALRLSVGGCCCCSIDICRENKLGLGAVANRSFAITKFLDANNSLRPPEDVLGSFLDELSGYRGPDDVGRSNVKLLVKPFWRNSPA